MVRSESLFKIGLARGDDKTRTIRRTRVQNYVPYPSYNDTLPELCAKPELSQQGWEEKPGVVARDALASPRCSQTSLLYLVWPSASSLLILQCFQCFPLRSFR